jgi:hypothetical protein
MGLLKWLVLPVSGPVMGTVWVANQLLEEAKRQHYDETAIRQEMLDLESQFAEGRMTESEFEEASDVLVQRLMDARAWHAEREIQQE